MKKIVNIFLSLLLATIISCSSDNSTPDTPKKVAPKAVADSYSMDENKTLTVQISDILKNDEIEKSVKYTFICESITSNKGTISVEKQKIIYTPKKDFVGKDTFTYTICREDATDLCSSTEITIEVKETENNTTTTSFNIPEKLKEYYKDLTFTTDTTQLKEGLKSIIGNYENQGYGKRHNYLYKADADLDNPENVVLMYSGEKRDGREYMSGSNSHSPQTFNTEHVYPQSLLKNQGKYKEGRGDLHHLRACDSKINSKRGNKPFGDGSGEYKDLGDKWFPGDEWKGDIARMIFYLNTMHDLTFEAVGSKELFLKWNIEDPVSDFEKQRNNEIQKGQKNRNPFIDNPYLATMIYGGNDAENTWK